MKNKLKEYLNFYLKPPEEHFRAAKLSSNNFMGRASMCMAQEAPMCMEEAMDISSFIKDNKEEDSFQMKLLKLIDERNLKDSDVYNKVNIDRRLFSKIRSNKDYHPTKETIILLGLSLELTEYELEDLLKSASYSLPMNNEYDLIIRFCFKEKIYDLFQLNEFLEDYNCKTLG